MVLEAASPVLRLSENARVVLERRYLAKDDNGDLSETPEQLFRRVAGNLAQAERQHGASDSRVREVEDGFYRVMTQLEFLPNSPTLGNAGRPLQQLSACFVLPVEDSIDRIFDTIKHTAMIHQTGGGTGFAFSRLRPEGSMVRSTAGVASGPVSFMKVFDASTEAIKQGGTRRGANMGILSIDHPDIEKFIDCKSDMVTCMNFNISVAVTEKFMRAVETGEDYDLIDPHTGKTAGTKNAAEIFERLVQNAWKNGDPGIIFIDRINAGTANPVPRLGPIESTNPCGEQPLYPYDSCNLGSINLARFVVQRNGGYAFDWDHLAEVVPVCVRFLDNVIDMNRYPIQEIADVSHRIRRIGLGVMGFADACMRLNLPYDSEEAVAFAEQVMGFIEQHANGASLELARDRGVFPEWEHSIFNMPDRYLDRPRYRNSTRTTIAPTGTLSIIADCSGGVEPVFALAYMRQHYLDRSDPTRPTKLTEVNEYFEEVAKRDGFYSAELMEYLAAGGALAERQEVPDWAKRVFVTAHDIAPEWHVRIQAAFQRHVDNAVSKTINFGHDATSDDVASAYRLAYREGCKGITIYRDGSRALQVLSHEKKQEAEPEPAVAVVLDPARPRRERLPDERQSVTHKFTVGEQEGYITVGLYEDGRPGEVFIKVSKQGSTVSGLMDNLALLTSMALQYGVPLGGLAEKLQNSRFEPSGMTRNPAIPTATSMVDYIFRYLAQRFVTGQQAPLPLAQQALFPASAILDAAPPAKNGHTGGAGGAASSGSYGANGYHKNGAAPISSGVGCPECGSVLHFAEGCLMCHGCGYSKCG
ncbi:MAG: vitamin B12-dependent ribonucleotide reductase [Dehalococcoidia bacterium]